MCADSCQRSPAIKHRRRLSALQGLSPHQHDIRAFAGKCNTLLEYLRPHTLGIMSQALFQTVRRLLGPSPKPVMPGVEKMNIGLFGAQ